MKNLLTLLLLIQFCSNCVLAQENEVKTELENILQSAKTLYVKPENLDRLMIRIRQFPAVLNEEESLLFLDCTRTISEQYAINNHYKQAYATYLVYLDKKESLLSGIQIRTLDSANQALGKKRQANVDELTGLQTTLNDLTTENEKYEQNISLFKRYFSLLIILLSGIFAILLVSFAVRFTRSNNKLKEYRDKMKELHRDSSIGVLGIRLTDATVQSINNLNERAKELSDKVSGIVAGASNLREQSGVLNSLTEKVRSILRKP